jgi:predicted amidohydrolase YtcJ
MGSALPTEDCAPAPVHLVNGVVHALGDRPEPADTLTIAGGSVAAGAEGATVVDLGGRCVVPGFNDAHVHFPTWALARRQVDVDGATSRADVVAAVAAAAKDATPERWLVGRGWREGDWDDGARAHGDALDAVTGPVPVALWSKDYHSLWLNSAALARAGGELDVEGGVVERDDDGSPTGVLREAAAWAFRERHIHFTADEFVEAMLAAIPAAHARGVTAVHDKDGWIGAIGLWQRIAADGALTLRVLQSMPFPRLDDLARLGLASGLGDEWLRLGHLKLFMDGALGSGTAAMLDGSGVSMTTGTELEDMILAAAAQRWPLAVHAIGDRANRDALDAFERTADVWRPRGLRQRIEHAQHVRAEDLDRFAAIGVACSVQFAHAPADRHLCCGLAPETLAGTYAFRTLWDSGALVVNGSDAPVDVLDPLRGIRAAVCRSTDDQPGFLPDQALTAREALLATTVNAALLAGDDGRRGRLVPGQVADLVVLDRDVLGVPADELAGVDVVATMTGGRWVHNPPPWD